MTSIMAPICIGCAHLDRGAEKPLLDPKCDAFPNGIPNEILLSEADHRQPFPGDRGIQFAPRGPKDAAYAEDLFAPPAIAPPAA